MVDWVRSLRVEKFALAAFLTISGDCLHTHTRRKDFLKKTLGYRSRRPDESLKIVLKKSLGTSIGNIDRKNFPIISVAGFNQRNFSDSFVARYNTRRTFKSPDVFPDPFRT